MARMDWASRRFSGYVGRVQFRINMMKRKILSLRMFMRERHRNVKMTRSWGYFVLADDIERCFIIAMKLDGMWIKVMNRAANKEVRKRYNFLYG